MQVYVHTFRIVGPVANGVASADASFVLGTVEEIIPVRFGSLPECEGALIRTENNEIYTCVPRYQGLRRVVPTKQLLVEFKALPYHHADSFRFPLEKTGAEPESWLSAAAREKTARGTFILHAQVAEDEMEEVIPRIRALPNFCSLEVLPE